MNCSSHPDAPCGSHSPRLHTLFVGVLLVCGAWFSASAPLQANASTGLAASGLAQPAKPAFDGEPSPDKQVLSIRLIPRDFFQSIGVKPAFGRSFSDQEDRLGGRPAVMLSYEIWQSLFGGKPEILGLDLELRGQRYTIIGILPEELQELYPQVDLWIASGLFA